VGLPRDRQPFVTDSLQTAGGSIPCVSSQLSFEDRLGSIKARWSIGRMNFTVEPGLYALGRPNESAPVVVTANYKMSFDRARQALQGRDTWILVLDTKGINVWCAAGKGTFGTEELVERIASSNLGQVVSHRQLIVPQLGAPGVSAHKVKKLSGFRVVYGPIEAHDLPAFLDAGLKATPQMRCKTFSTWERLELVPVELVSALKTTLMIVPVLLFLSGLGGPGSFFNNVLTYGSFPVASLLGAVLAGAILGPLLLPWLPGRPFALKGLFLGLITTLFISSFRAYDLGHWSGRFELFAWFLILPAVTAYLTMNFTGASTYTSLSGVRKEMRWAVPLQIGAAVIGFGLWLISRFIA
jgi:hypothetical protein